MIPELDAVAAEVEDNVLNAYTVIGLDTPLIDAISYMVDLPVLLIWLSLLTNLRVQVQSQGAHLHLRGVILTSGEYEEYLRLTQAAKSSSIASVA